LNGIYKEWHEDGKPKKEANYTNGKLDGIYKVWFGEIKKETLYINGVNKEEEALVKQALIDANVGKIIELSEIRKEQAFIKQIDPKRRKRVQEILLDTVMQNAR
jgi:antitoxin component YwqK of YwqJK toxin-antitoxin module